MGNSQKEVSMVMQDSEKVDNESDNNPDNELVQELVESQAGDVVVRKGRAIRSDGTIQLRVVKPGWGTSGYYPAEVLERDGPSIYRAGTQMFWDHATASEDLERPEGSLRNLAAVLSTPARWDDQGAVGPGLYADALVFESYRETVDEIGPHIGTSIRGLGRATTGEAEGRKGRIISALTTGLSVDFVTKAGAGGEIVQLFEASNGTAVSSVAEPSGVHNSGVMDMDDLEKAQEKLAEAQKVIQALETERDQLSKSLLLRDASAVVSEALDEAALPAVTVQRLRRSVACNLPMTEAGKLDVEGLKEKVNEAVIAETAYLQEAAGFGQGRIEGMGGSQTAASGIDMVEVQKRMDRAFTDLGFTAGKGE